MRGKVITKTVIESLEVRNSFDSVRYLLVERYVYYCHIFIYIEFCLCLMSLCSVNKSLMINMCAVH